MTQVEASVLSVAPRVPRAIPCCTCDILFVLRMTFRDFLLREETVGLYSYSNPT